jgi:hypothetical protein
VRAKFIYEKFEEHSDPIHDLGIGIKEKLKNSLLPRLLTYATKKDKIYLKEFFGVSWEQLYYLGDSEDIERIYNIYKYREKIEKLIGNENKVYQKTYIDTYVSVFKGYKTEFGKIATLKSKPNYGSKETYYIGDIEIAVKLGIMKIDWKKHNYH